MIEPTTSDTATRDLIVSLRAISGLDDRQLARLLDAMPRHLAHWAVGIRMSMGVKRLAHGLRKEIEKLGLTTPGETRHALLKPGADGRSIYDELMDRVRASRGPDIN
jgi:hypothetical protein